MRCPYCREDDDKVVDSRSADDGSGKRRRRECLACGRRFTTYERVEDIPLVVVKRTGVEEPFDRAKLRAGIERAASDRVASEAITALVDRIESEVLAAGGRLDSDRIGMAVLDGLSGADEVAYLRFASVYKGFEDVADFERELGALRDRASAAAAPGRGARVQRRGEKLLEKKAPKP
jgi:transcriptional repressor NrdR